MSSIKHQTKSFIDFSKYNAKMIIGSIGLIGFTTFIAKNKIIQIHRIGCIKPSQHIIESAKKSSFRIDVSHHKIWMGIKILTMHRGFGMSYLIRPNLAVTNYHVVESFQNADSNSFVKNIIIRNFSGKVIARGKVVHSEPEKDLAFVEFDSSAVKLAVKLAVNESNMFDHFKYIFKKNIGYPYFIMRASREYIVSIIKTSFSEIMCIITKTNTCKNKIGNSEMKSTGQVFTMRYHSGNVNIRCGQIICFLNGYIKEIENNQTRFICDDPNNKNNMKAIEVNILASPGFSGAGIFDHYSGDFLGINRSSDIYYPLASIISTEEIMKELQKYDCMKNS